MAIIRPGEYRAGNRLQPGMLQKLAEGMRAAIPKRVQGKYVRRTRMGWSTDEEVTLSGLVIRTGSSGIPARIGSVPGKATDVIHEAWDGDELVAADTITVYNISSMAVGAFRYGVALDTEGRWVVVVESCS